MEEIGTYRIPTKEEIKAAIIDAVQNKDLGTGQKSQEHCVHITSIKRPKSKAKKGGKRMIEDCSKAVEDRANLQYPISGDGWNNNSSSE